jgi:hypothetical protein
MTWDKAILEFLALKLKLPTSIYLDKRESFLLNFTTLAVVAQVGLLYSRVYIHIKRVWAAW